MADKIILSTQDDLARSFNFGFQFDDGTGITTNQTVSVSYDEAADMQAAYQAALQKAANAKKLWLDRINEDKARVTLIGEVVLPQPAD